MQEDTFEIIKNNFFFLHLIYRNSISVAVSFLNYTKM